MIDIDNTMTRDETAKPSRRHRPRGGRKNRKGSRDEAEPSKKLFNPDSGELFDPEDEARKAEAEAARKREERERQAVAEKEAAAGRNAKADEWRPSEKPGRSWRFEGRRLPRAARRARAEASYCDKTAPSTTKRTTVRTTV